MHKMDVLKVVEFLNTQSYKEGNLNEEIVTVPQAQKNEFSCDLKNFKWSPGGMKMMKSCFHSL